MKLKNKIYTLLSVFTLVGLTHSLTLKELNASLTPPTTYNINYNSGTTFSANDNVRVRIAYVNGAVANLPTQYSTVASPIGWIVYATVTQDVVYNTFAVDGSTLTSFEPDYINDKIKLVIGSNFYLSDLYSWYCYNQFTEEGIADIFMGIRAVDVGNFLIDVSIVDMFIDNGTAINLRQLDNRRIYRSDGEYPVTSSGGGGIDVVWRNTILVAEVGTSGLTLEESSTLAKINELTENSSGLRFTSKALEQAPSGGSGSGVTLAEIESSAILAKEATSKVILGLSV
jgi:hypothetical protein